MYLDFLLYRSFPCLWRLYSSSTRYWLHRWASAPGDCRWGWWHNPPRCLGRFWVTGQLYWVIWLLSSQSCNVGHRYGPRSAPKTCARRPFLPLRPVLGDFLLPRSVLRKLFLLQQPGLEIVELLLPPRCHTEPTFKGDGPRSLGLKLKLFSLSGCLLPVVTSS